MARTLASQVGNSGSIPDRSTIYALVDKSGKVTCSRSKVILRVRLPPRAPKINVDTSKM